MSLRDALRRAIASELHVASPKARNVQPGASRTATDDATPMQLQAWHPHECWLSDATGDATPAQPAPEADATAPHGLTVAKLQAMGLSAEQADALAYRIEQRDADDPRRACVECANCRPGLTCAAPRASGYPRQMGSDLAALPQHCPAFRSSAC